MVLARYPSLNYKGHVHSFSIAVLEHRVVFYKHALLALVLVSKPLHLWVHHHHHLVRYPSTNYRDHSTDSL